MGKYVLFLWIFALLWGTDIPFPLKFKSAAISSNLSMVYMVSNRFPYISVKYLLQTSLHLGLSGVSHISLNYVSFPGICCLRVDCCNRVESCNTLRSTTLQHRQRRLDRPTVAAQPLCCHLQDSLGSDTCLDKLRLSDWLGR